MTTYAQHYLPRFYSYQSEFLQRLALLVNIDSGTGQTEGINCIVEHLQDWFTALDFTVTLHPTSNFGNNLVARRKGQGHRRIMLVGHIDTVYSAGSAQKQPFSIRNNQAYGPGVTDMKAGVLLGLYALTALIEKNCDAYSELIVVCNNDEEVGSPESSPLLRELAHEVDVALVLEPSCEPFMLTRARKGTDKYTLEVIGVAAHSGSEPHKGRSAVLELAHKIVAIYNLHMLFPGVTLNVTALDSTEPHNIIADNARCHISVRSFQQKGLDAVAAALEEIVAGCSVPGTHSMLVRRPGRAPYVSTPEVLQLLALAQEEGQALGLNLQGETKGGVSDANVLMAAGIPTLDGLGPIGRGIHNLEHECLDLDSLAQRGALLAGLLHRLCLL